MKLIIYQILCLCVICDKILTMEEPAEMMGYVEIKLYDKDGNLKDNREFTNTITSVGKKIAADQIGGTTTTPVTAIALGEGTPSATALGSEITTNGGSRVAATITNETTTTTGDTEQWVKTFTFTGSLAITEEGLFDNNTSGGKMLAAQSFAALDVITTDTLEVTHKIKFV
jgi:hypothetical protein